MPSAALYFSPLALLPPGIGIALRYTVALICVWLTLRWLHEMVRRDQRAAVATRRFGIAALTLILASHYVIRDLDDGGPHLILLAILVAGTVQAYRGNEGWAGVWFGLASALKAPFGLYLPFFIWKRRWRLAASTATAAACWIVVPAVWMGPAHWWTQQREWTRVVAASLAGDPVPGAAESEHRLQNQALKPAVLRYLVTFPEGDPRHLAHPADVPLLNLNAATADRIATLAVLGLVLVFACWARTPYRAPDEPRWLLECSGVLVLTALLSPVAWVQHLVVVIPALYLIVAAGRRRLGTAATAAVVVYAILAVVLNREVVTRELYLVFLSYHAQTLCMLLILAVLMLRRPTAT
jgi:alpha-1,2-mannosyltransferase